MAASHNVEMRRMSEYQYYEFLAIDRPLSEQEQAELRELSTRARISATSFTTNITGVTSAATRGA